MSYEEQEKLAASHGWTITCHSPFEMECYSTSGGEPEVCGTATGRGAQDLMDYFQMLEQLPDIQKKAYDNGAADERMFPSPSKD